MKSNTGEICVGAASEKYVMINTGGMCGKYFREMCKSNCVVATFYREMCEEMCEEQNRCCEVCGELHQRNL